ncbi:MAG TPA: GNAT family N-acetyltransferase [Polyangiales bacterium]
MTLSPPLGPPRYRLRTPDLSKDTDACARVQVSAFGHNHWPFWQKGHHRLATDFVRVMGMLGDLNFVAEDADTGRIVGLLFAGYPMDGKAVRRALSSIVKLLWFGFVGLWVWKGETFRHGIRFLRAIYRLAKVHPSYEPHAEIIEFAVHEEAQRKGVGKLLMDAAVRELHRRGAKQVVLMTDSTMSWTFYERYGFARVRDVDFGATYEIATGSSSEHGYSYELDVPKRVAEMDNMPER